MYTRVYDRHYAADVCAIDTCVCMCMYVCMRLCVFRPHGLAHSRDLCQRVTTTILESDGVN